MINKANPRGAADFTNPITTAPAEQTVAVTGMAAAEQILPKLVASLRQVLNQQAELANQIEKVRDTHPLTKALISMPGVGIRTAARILLNVSDTSQFPTANHLATYAGFAPINRHSGTSIRCNFPTRSGNKHLKRTLLLPAFVALRTDPVTRAYYDRKRTQDKTQRSPDLPIPPPLRRPDRHDQEPRNLPDTQTNPNTPHRLTRNIRTPRGHHAGLLKPSPIASSPSPRTS